VVADCGVDDGSSADGALYEADAVANAKAEPNNELDLLAVLVAQVNCGDGL
jgi:hypothetical protein